MGFVDGRDVGVIDEGFGADAFAEGADAFFGGGEGWLEQDEGDFALDALLEGAVDGDAFFYGGEFEEFVVAELAADGGEVFGGKSLGRGRFAGRGGDHAGFSKTHSRRFSPSMGE